MAEASDKSPEQVLKEILAEYFADLQKDTELAAAVLAQHRPAVSLQDIKAQLGL